MSGQRLICLRCEGVEDDEAWVLACWNVDETDEKAVAEREAQTEGFQVREFYGEDSKGLYGAVELTAECKKCGNRYREVQGKYYLARHDEMEGGLQAWRERNDG